MVQEFMLYLCQLPDHKLEELTTKYNIKWYAIRSFVNMIHGNTRTQFFKNNLRISETLPDNVDTTDFDFSSWPNATIYTAAQVGVKPAYSNFTTQFGSAQFVWSTNLVLDNLVLLRFTGN